jgi:AcrR family transcriptional regulator
VGDRREAAILETALRLLAERPLSAITIDELARGAGLSRSTFYFYFDSRDAVIKAMFANTETSLQGVLEPMTTSAEPRTAVRDTVALYLQRWAEHGPVLRAMVPLAEGDRETRDFWTQVRSGVAGTLADLIDRERAAGRAVGAPPDASDLSAALAAMMWRAGYDYSLSDTATADHDRIVVSLSTVIVRAIWSSDT